MPDKFTMPSLQSVLLIGYSSIMDDLLQWCERKNLKTEIITSPAQIDFFKEKQRLPIKVFEKIDSSFKEHIEKNHELKTTLFLSFGARWIFKKTDIQNFFKNNLVNFHGSRLPFDAGGGGFSWRIMRGDKICLHLAHLIDEGIDTGPIIKSSESLFPPNCIRPIEYEEFYKKGLALFCKNLLEEIISGKIFSLYQQPDYIGHYNPRLNAKVHGAIDWSNDAIDLYRFINAFDEPYCGACTYHNGNLVHIKSAQIHGGEPNDHPFMSGLIKRVNKNWLLVSTGTKESIIIQNVTDENGNNIIHKIQPGDRFYTPQERLDAAKSHRAFYKSV